MLCAPSGSWTHDLQLCSIVEKALEHEKVLSFFFLMIQSYDFYFYFWFIEVCIVLNKSYRGGRFVDELLTIERSFVILITLLLCVHNNDTNYFEILQYVELFWNVKQFWHFMVGLPVVLFLQGIAYFLEWSNG